MDLTLNIVIRELAPFLKDWDDKNVPTRHFKDIAFLTHTVKPDPSTLYIATSNQVTKYKAFLNCDCTIICNYIKKRPANTSCTLIELLENVNILDVCNILQCLKQRLWNWGTNLQIASLSGVGLQALIDMSEPFFTNPIFLTTRALQIPACTQNIPIPHPDLRFALAHKVFPENMIQAIVSKRFLEESESHSELSFSYPPNHIGCPFIVRRFDDNALQLNTICIYELNTPLTGADFDLMSFLSDAIFQYATEFSPEPFGSMAQNKLLYFLLDIINGRMVEHELHYCDTLFGIDPNADYQVGLVRFNNLIESHILYTTQLIEAFMPYVKAFQYDDGIVLLLQVHDRKEEQLNELWEQLIQILRNNDAYCGISDIFSHIQNLKDAYEKAKAAAQIGRMLEPNQVIYKYSSYYIFHLLKCASMSMSYESLYFRQLDRVIAYDSSHNSDNMKLLEYYLSCDRNITKVSNHMHLHRNSVLYRISKIEELLGLSLDDPEVRLALLVSFRALKLLQVKSVNDESSNIK